MPRTAAAIRRDSEDDRMSPASIKPGADRRAYLGDEIVEELRASGLPFGPRQFEFWFSHKRGRNAALSAAADSIRAEAGALSAADIERLHEVHLSPWRLAKSPETIVARLAEKLDDIARTLDGAIGSTHAQRETLTAGVTHLGRESSPTLQDVLNAIDRLARSAKENQTHNALIEARMEAAHREIAVVKRELSVVRAECKLDPTTALPNRATFNALLESALNEAADARQPLSIILCNLDYFRAFNEHFGDYAGDEVLRSIGLLFKAQVRNADTVTRFGGDEYAAILPQMRTSDAVDCAERFRQVLMAHELIAHPNGAGRVTVSIGVADAIKGDTPEYLLRRAGNGLRVAKREGRNRVVEMTPDGPVWNAARRV